MNSELWIAGTKKSSCTELNIVNCLHNGSKAIGVPNIIVYTETSSVVGYTKTKYLMIL